MSIYREATEGLHGRRTIYSSTDTVTKENVIQLVNDALSSHVKNLYEEDYLYWYRRGVQPILNRKKEIRPEINNKITINHASEIVSFKNGYFLTQPAYYTARNADVQEKVDELNEYLYRSGKHDVDNEVVDWFHTVGRAAIIIEPNDDKENPIGVYALDPRSAFVVYSMRPGNKPVMGINMIVTEKTVKFDVFTEKSVFRLSGGCSGDIIRDDRMFTATASKLDSVEANVLRKIPIIEYNYNSVGMGAFESVITLLDAINEVESNRCDGVEQFIQSLAVAVNCQFDDGTTANDIRQAGMLCLTSIGDNRADFKILSEQLDQSQTQVLLDSLYDQVLDICGMPSSNKGDTSTSDTGVAVLSRNGWKQASAYALNTEDLFKQSNKRFEEIMLDILKRKNILDLKISDIELKFVRNEEANIQSKAQALQTLLAAGVEPTLAFAKSGVSNDPVSDFMLSEPYLKMIWGDPELAEVKSEQELEMAKNPPMDATMVNGSDPASNGVVNGASTGSAVQPGEEKDFEKDQEGNVMGRQTKNAFSDRSVAQLDKETGKQIRVFASLKEASSATGVNNRTISDVCNGHSAYGGKWKWKYVSGKNFAGEEE